MCQLSFAKNVEMISHQNSSVENFRPETFLQLEMTIQDVGQKKQNLTQLAENSLNSTAGQNLRENTRNYLIFSYWPKIGRKDFPRLMMAKKLQNLAQLAEKPKFN